jgi:hypothetical protein
MNIGWLLCAIPGGRLSSNRFRMVWLFGSLYRYLCICPCLAKTSMQDVSISVIMANIDYPPFQERFIIR